MCNEIHINKSSYLKIYSDGSFNPIIMLFPVFKKVESPSEELIKRLFGLLK